MKILFILNDAPYGIEKIYNGLRLADSLTKREGTQVRVFLIGDAAASAKQGQQLPNGYYNLEKMLLLITRRKAEVGVCGSCMDARAMDEAELVPGCHRSTMEELTDWTTWADRVLVF